MWIAFAIGLTVYCVAGWMLLTVMAAAEREPVVEPHTDDLVHHCHVVQYPTDEDLLRKFAKELAARDGL